MKIDLRDIEKTNEVVAIYLFGSVSQGKSNKYSDIDICVIGDISDSSKKKILVKFPEPYDISFFDELPVWIKMRVLKGKLLFVKDKNELYDYIFRTLANYEDFKYLLNERVRRRFGKEVGKK